MSDAPVDVDPRCGCPLVEPLILGRAERRRVARQLEAGHHPGAVQHRADCYLVGQHEPAAT